MPTHVSERQVRWWLDRNAIHDVTAHTQEETEFNLQVTLSSLPIHLIKEEPKGPIRVVGRSGLDSERARRLVRDDEQRAELLSQIGPVLATTPGFYTFLDEESRGCELREAETLQMEHRIYPDGASQQALMDSVMAIATGMRYLQNLLAASSPEESPELNRLESKSNHESEED
ncbi:hypothetical protein [Halopiger aswanensis]|uniref:Uncharacterized protein n=1 Tax=Halopiger aswanensis TaxID=148449 RepID=A0A419WDY2_9EURY|nr:hypothetical protein [Halopiger aswanensis]RKD93526.1 hypothetical protein ATJ93_3155 [Halopiger aswanensis]